MPSITINEIQQKWGLLRCKCGHRLEHHSGIKDPAVHIQPCKKCECSTFTLDRDNPKNKELLKVLAP